MKLHWIFFVCATWCLRVYGTSDENGIPLNPCPNIFQYGYDNAEWFGYIQIKVLPSVEATKLEVFLSLPTGLALESKGSLELLRSSKNSIKDIQSNKPVWYRVHFPLQSQIPELSKILVNGQIVCSGVRESGTPILLEHTLFTDDSKNPHEIILQSPEPVENLLRNSTTIPEVPPSEVPRETVNPQISSTQTHEPVSIQQTQYEHQQEQHQLQQQLDLQSQYDIRNNFDLQNQFEPKNQLKSLNQFDQSEPQYLLPNQSHQQYQPKLEYHPPLEEPQCQSRIQKPDNTSQSEQEICGKIAERFENTQARNQIFLRGASPWVVTVYINQITGLTFHCVGNLVSSKIVVTAANCFKTSERLYRPDEIVLILGRYNILNWFEDGHKTAEVHKIVIHQDYIAKDIVNFNNYILTSYEANIALALMRERVYFTDFIRPICLWQEPSNLDDLLDTVGTVISWKQGYNVLSDEPSNVPIPIVSDATCLHSNNVYRYITLKRSYCGVQQDGTGSCYAEAGSGMAISRNGRWFLRGVVSSQLGDRFAHTCNLENYVIFTDVAKFVDWITAYEKF